MSWKQGWGQQDLKCQMTRISETKAIATANGMLGGVNVSPKAHFLEPLTFQILPCNLMLFTTHFFYLCSFNNCLNHPLKMSFLSPIRYFWLYYGFTIYNSNTTIKHSLSLPIFFFNQTPPCLSYLGIKKSSLAECHAFDKAFYLIFIEQNLLLEIC